MITLITGTPGAGKTLYTVAEELPKFAERPLYVDGIPDLLLPHEPSQDVEAWHDWLPENGVLVVDEAQRVWRPRASGSKVPPGVAAMETHRHRGADIILITQHPNLIDPNIRRLVGRHLHVRRVWGLKRSLVYEWDQATDPGRVSTAQKRMWSYPTKAFGQYKSATVHTTRGQKPPFMLWVAIAAVLGVPTVGYFAYDRIKSRAENPLPTVQANTPVLPGATAQVHDQWNAGEFENPIISFTPQYPDVPHSAPAYAGLVHVESAPRIQGCVASRTRCICYTQQQTRLAISDDLCRRHAAGLEFDPYRQEQAPQQLAMPQPNMQAPQGPEQDQAIQEGPDRVFTPPVDDFKNPFARSRT